tara:strand:+ start:588 stop:809 length:222 start_codon:yes stop_codon:yes gene_type:complete
MTTEELMETIDRMETYGGSFIRSMAKTLFFADPINSKKILDAFPEIQLTYGPNSNFHLQEVAAELAENLIEPS